MSNDTDTTVEDLAHRLAFDAAQHETNLANALLDLSNLALSLRTDVLHNGLGRESVLSEATRIVGRAADIAGRAGRIAGINSALETIRWTP